MIKKTENSVKALEQIIVFNKHISCDGGIVYGHPKIYLEIGAEKKVKCPYCDKIFIYQEK